MQEEIYSVSEINSYIKSLLDGDDGLRNVQVLGEISNFKRYPSGHCYFTLKDAGAILKCVMFKGKAFSLRFDPKNGDTVLAVGRIAVYERDGVYQLYTDLLVQQGVGDLMLAYEKLKAKLGAEGLFAPERKQALPINPQSVGIITSPAGAAVRDIISVARRRNPGLKLYLYPVQVQGTSASEEISKAIEFFNKTKLAEVLIVGRGGGSIEDLWAFNEERTVRAVAKSKLPIISAVGHETDFTLCDFAADMRAATPSQAAEMAVVDTESVRQYVGNLYKRAESLLLANLKQKEYRLQHAANSWAMRDAQRLLETSALRVDAASERLQQLLQEKLALQSGKLGLACARLQSLSPLAVLGRGYSVTTGADGKVVTSVQNVRWGDELKTKLADGEIISVVQSVEDGDNGSKENC